MLTAILSAEGLLRRVTFFCVSGINLHQKLSIFQSLNIIFKG
jgi:hypothetical protein